MAIKNHLIQAYKQAPWRTATQNGALFMIGLVIAACVIWIMVTVSVKTTDAGLELNWLVSEKLRLNREIASKNAQIADATSSEQMQKRIDGMGFRPATPADITYIVIDGFTGRQPKISAPPPQSVQPPLLIKQIYTQSLSDWLWQGALKLTEKPEVKLP